MRNASILFVTLLACVLFLGSTALDVRSTTMSASLFLDDFEGGTPGSPPDNGALPGGWSPTPSTLIRANPTAPSAFTGDQFLEVLPGGSINANFNSLPAGGSVHVETMIYLSSAAPNTTLIVALGNNTLFGGGGNIYGLSNAGSNIVDLANGKLYNVNLQRNTWQKLEIDYLLGSNALTITLDGVSDTDAIGPDRISSDASQLDIRDLSGGGQFYLDAVPEPTTLALVGLGGLVMLKRQRKSA